MDVAAVEKCLAGGVIGFRSSRDVLRVSGGDAAEYLQGQLSQDVHGLVVGSSKPTLLLKPQGHLDAWMRITRLAENEFVLDIDADYGDQAHDRLTRFAIRVDLLVEVETMPMVAVRGPQADRALADGIAGWVLEPLWSDSVGFDLLGGHGEMPAGVNEGPPTGFDLARILCGAPAMGSEIGGSTIPASVGVVDRAVDFNKGCYVGQELVARIDSRGAATPFKLRGVEIGSGGANPGDELIDDGQVVGHITSVADRRDKQIGLALVKRAVEIPADLGLGSPNQNEARAVRVVSLPFPLEGTSVNNSGET